MLYFKLYFVLILRILQLLFGEKSLVKRLFRFMIKVLFILTDPDFVSGNCPSRYKILYLL